MQQIRDPGAVDNDDDDDDLNPDSPSKNSTQHPSSAAYMDSILSPINEVLVQEIRGPSAVDTNDDDDDLNLDAAPVTPTADKTDTPIDTTGTLTITLSREDGTPLGMQVMLHRGRCSNVVGTWGQG